MAKRTTLAFPHPEGTERMHALDNGMGGFILDNAPFHVYGVSCGDIVCASLEDGDLVFKRVLSRGGHSTYRIRLPVGKGHDEYMKFWQNLEKLGCTFEGSSVDKRRLYSIDVPPGTSVEDVYSLLEEGERLGVWEFEEAHYFDPSRPNA